MAAAWLYESISAVGTHPNGDCVSVPTVRMSKATFQVYRDRADEWRWRLVHDNGNVIADGGQGYASKRSALNGIRSVQENAPGAPIEEHDIREIDDSSGSS